MPKAAATPWERERDTAVRATITKLGPGLTTPTANAPAMPSSGSNWFNCVSLPLSGQEITPPASGHEPHVLRIVDAVEVAAEVPQVRQDPRQVDVRHAEPLGQRGAVLVDGGRRNQPALPHMAFVAGLTGIVVDADHLRRAVELLALDRAADDEVMAAPAVIGPVAIAGQRAAEVGRRESSDL